MQVVLRVRLLSVGIQGSSPSSFPAPAGLLVTMVMVVVGVVTPPSSPQAVVRGRGALASMLSAGRWCGLVAVREGLVVGIQRVILTITTLWGKHRFCFS